MNLSAELIFITYFFNLTCQAIFNRILGSSQNCAVGVKILSSVLFLHSLRLSSDHFPPSG